MPEKKRGGGGGGGKKKKKNLPWRACHGSVGVCVLTASHFCGSGNRLILRLNALSRSRWYKRSKYDLSSFRCNPPPPPNMTGGF